LKRVIAIACFVLITCAGLMCAKRDPNFVRVKISTPDDEIVFTGYYMSTQQDSIQVDATTSASYQIPVDPEGDSVYARFAKSDETDTKSELDVRLYYMGKTKDEAEVTSGWAEVGCTIP